MGKEYTPFKMKGHSLPGPNQVSPMKKTTRQERRLAASQAALNELEAQRASRKIQAEDEEEMQRRLKKM